MLQVVALASIATVVLTAAAVALAAQPQESAAPAGGQTGSAPQAAPAGSSTGTALSSLPAPVGQLTAAADQSPATVSNPPATVNLIVTVPVIVGGVAQREPEVLNGTVVVASESYDASCQVQGANVADALPAPISAHRYELPVPGGAVAAPALTAGSRSARAAVDVVA